MRQNHGLLIALVLAVSVCLADRAAAQTLYVHAGATGANDGSSWTNAYNSLQDALLHAAGSGGSVTEIWVAAGAYMPDGGFTPVGGTHVPGSGDRLATFQLLNGVALYGGFTGVETTRSQRDVTANETILSGDLAGDDVPVECTSHSQCVGFGTLCADSFCIIADSNAENSYNVTTGNSTDSTAIVDGFTITGGNANGAYPNGQGAGMHNKFGAPTVTNCTLRGNMSDQEGAGMCNESSNPTLTKCTFYGNSAEVEIGAGMINIFNSSPTITDTLFSWNWGDGMSNFFNSNPTVSRCRFHQNRKQGGWGGGMQNDQGSNPTVTECIFIENSASTGAGMANLNSNPIVVDCIFIGNSAFEGGGMGNVSNSSPIVTNCLFMKNRATTSRFGGGMSNRSNSNPRVTNCIFSGNSTTGISNGGGMGNSSSSPMVANCTFNGNVAGVDGGGIWNQDNSNPILINSIFWDNSDSSGTGSSAQIHTVSGTPVVNYSIVQGGWSGAGGVGVLDVDPMFVDPLGPDGVVGTEDDNLRLMAGSPAIDAGDNAAVPSGVFTDIGGNERIAYGTVDIGAYEFCPAQRMYGDVNVSGTVNFSDVSLVLDVFRGLQTTITFEDADVFPCGGDDNVNFSDVSAAIDAFRGLPPCPDICI
jgi:hypothetical protein